MSDFAHLIADAATPHLDTSVIFDRERFPNLVTLRDGTILATWGTTRLLSRRSCDGGETWEPVVEIGEGIQGGGTLVDEGSGDVLAFTHPEHPPKEGDFAPRTQYRSSDAGRSWQAEDATFLPDVNGHVPSLAYSERGITIEYGRRAGRLIRPARVYGQSAESPAVPYNGRRDGYNTAIFSDDHGRTWQPSKPFPIPGTGEGCIEQRRDGRLYYSSRKHSFADDETRTPMRLHAWSDDGGETWIEPAYHQALPDGPRYRGEERRASCWNGHFGMAGGLTRLRRDDQDIFIYSNTDQPEHTRHRMTVWASFDGGRTWPIKRLIDEGPAAYSSLTAGRPDTPSDGWVYLLIERWGDQAGAIGPEGCGEMVRFNLAWLAEGESAE